MFQPQIVSLQAQELNRAILRQTLTIEHSGTREAVQYGDGKIEAALGESSQLRGVSGPGNVDLDEEGLPLEENGFISPIDIRLDLRCNSVRRNDVEAIWCLNSLISRENVIAQLRDVCIVFNLDSEDTETWYAPGGRRVTYRREPSQPGWESVVRRLLEKLGGLAKVRLWVTGTGALKKKILGKDGEGTAAVPVTGHSNSCDKPSHHRSEPIPLESPSNTGPQKIAIEGHLTFLSFKGDVFHPILRPFVDQLIYQSSSSLTNLHLRECDSAWTDIVPRWTLPKITRFSLAMAESDISLRAILLFLCNNLSIEDADITTSADSVNVIQAGDITSLPKTLPNLRRLYGTPEILLPLLQSFLSFPNLEDVTIDPTAILGLANWDALTEILSQLPPLGTKRLQTLSISLPLEEELSEWLRSASSNAATALFHTSLSSILPGLGTIRHLVLRAHISLYTYLDSRYHTFTVDSDTIFKFVGTFPGVEEVVIDASFFASSDRALLLESLSRIWGECGHLKVFRIRGKEKDLAMEDGAWKRGHEAPTHWSEGPLDCFYDCQT